MSCASAKSSASLAFLRVIRLVRVLKLTKHSVGLQVLIMTVRASSEELGLFLVILLVCMLVYSSIVQVPPSTVAVLRELGHASRRRHRRCRVRHRDCRLSRVLR